MRDLKIKILDSILHGDLKPWKMDASDQRRFTELVKVATATSPQTYAELQKQLATLLNNYPSLQKIVDEETQNGDNLLVQHFFKIDLPKYNDPPTQFYHSIITKEALRFFNHYLQNAETWVNPIDIHFHVNKTLTDIRVLATQTAEELAQRGFVSFPDKKSDFVHIVLFTLKQMLTALFFEVQERFAKQLLQNTTEEFYYLHYLKEPSPATPALIPDTAYFEFHFHLIQKAPEFSKGDTLHLLKQMQQHQSDNSLKLQSALENLIFLHSQNIEIEINTIEQLTNSETVKQFTEASKQIALNKIESKGSAMERLEVVQSFLDDLDYDGNLKVKNSIVQKYFKWLTDQKIFYATHHSEQFKIVTSEKSNNKKTFRKKFSFGFIGDLSKLKVVLSQLALKIDLLNEQSNTIDELLNILTSKNFNPGSIQINLGCETAQFRYVVDGLKIAFSNLKLTTIERSNIFYSKTGTPITAQNLSSSKIDNPKTKDLVDNILKHLQ